MILRQNSVCWGSRFSSTTKIFVQRRFCASALCATLHRGHIEFRNHELGSKSGKNLKIGNVTGGHGYQRFGLKKSQHSHLSLSFTFLSYMNVKYYQKYHHNTRNMKKRILASNIGALPILQECPYRSTSTCSILTQDSRLYYHTGCIL